ncbi:MAG: hypothetical protein OJF60_002143 [Burkholderiaceae bacterium]|jgi:pimeloyl-ACP methyl ester carboxylesterase|nr:MAG: hypothetical protein OJF60_002143 [Burkholderiaceae bacterium]
MNTHLLIGNGPRKVIGLHGWFTHGGGWGPMVDVLDTGNFTYAFMDCRGYGGMKGRGGPYTMEQTAADALALADALSWDRFSLLGYSMCATAAQLVLLQAPKRVERMVAITPVPASGFSHDDGMRALFKRAATDAAVRRRIIDMTTGLRLCDTWLDQMVASSLENSDQDAFAAYLPSWAESDFHAKIQGNPLPVKVIAGQHNPALGVSVMQETFMRWYPNAVLEQMDNAGHYPMYETPIALATSIEAFLRG